MVFAEYHRQASSNKEIIQYKLIERETLHDQDSRQTIRLALQTTFPPNDEYQNNEIRSGAHYLPGDHLAIYPENNSDLVRSLIRRLLNENSDTSQDEPKMDPNQQYWVKIQKLSSLDSNSHNANGAGSAQQADLTKAQLSPPKSTGMFNLFGGAPEAQAPQWILYGSLPMPISLMDALTRYLDITTPPTQQFLSLCSDFADNENDREVLKRLAQNIASYETWKSNYHPNLLEVF